MDQKSEFRILGFTTLSAITHIALVAAILTMNVSSEPKSQSVTMEFPGESAPQTEAAPADAAAAEAPAIQEVAITETTAPAPAVETAKAEEIVLPAKPVEKVKQAAAPKIAKSLPKAARPAVQAKAEAPAQEAQAEPEYTQEESPVALPIVQDSKVDAEPTKEELNEEEIAQDLEKVEAEESAKLAAVQAQLKKDADEAMEKQMKEQQAKAALIQKQNEEEKARIAAAQAAKAQEEKRKQDEAKAVAIAAAAAAKASQNSGNGEGTGTQGSGAGEIRSLADLKQMPGNSVPQYDSNDRLNQRKGDVAFQAMVTKEGTLTGIKLLKSSGHRELDAKTLKAIKSWKFYPGQEGLVEIPMKWDLTGEVQAIHGGRLRSGTNVN